MRLDRPEPLDDDVLAHSRSLPDSGSSRIRLLAAASEARPRRRVMLVFNAARLGADGSRRRSGSSGICAPLRRVGEGRAGQIAPPPDGQREEPADRAWRAASASSLRPSAERRPGDTLVTSARSSTARCKHVGRARRSLRGSSGADVALRRRSSRDVAVACSPPSSGSLRRDEVDRLDAVGAFVDRAMRASRQQRRRARLLDEAHAAMHLHAHARRPRRRCRSERPLPPASAGWRGPASGRLVVALGGARHVERVGAGIGDASGRRGSAPAW